MMHSIQRLKWNVRDRAAYGRRGFCQGGRAPTRPFLYIAIASNTGTKSAWMWPWKLYERLGTPNG
jgi:hypothetical protein